MQIVSQTNSYECGICCLLMLFNHYQINHQIDKEVLYSECELNANGISILDLEALSNKYGVFLDSYNATWEEVIEDNTKNPFILVKNVNNQLHYVLAVKTKNGITIYDPGDDKPTKLDKSTPLKDYSNIYIKTELVPNFVEPKKIKSNFAVFKNNQYIIWCSIISIITIAIQLFCSFIISQLMNKIQTTTTYLILIMIFGMLFFYISNGFIRYALFVLRYKLLNKQYIINLSYLFKRLSFKKPSFYNTIDKNIFNSSYVILKNNIYFYNDFIVSIISNSFFAVGSLIFIIFINWQFLWFVLINLIIVYLLNYFEYRFNKKKSLMDLDVNNKLQDKMIKFSLFNKGNYSKEFNEHALLDIKTRIKRWELNKNNINSKNLVLNIIERVWNDVYLLLIILLQLLLSKDKLIGTLLFCLQILTLLNSHLAQIINLANNSSSFKIIKEMLTNLFSLNNFAEEQKQAIKTSISLQENNLYYYQEEFILDKFINAELEQFNINSPSSQIVLLDYETMNDLVVENLDKYIDFAQDENKHWKDFFDIIQNHRQSEKTYTRLELFIIYLIHINENFNNKVILINSDLDLNHNNTEYKTLVSNLIKEIAKKNITYLIKSQIVDGLCQK